VRVFLAFVGATVVLGAGCGGDDERAGSGGSGDVVTISNVQQFEHAFNEDTGHPRLVLLLSPT
jgi:hypothetical protein